MKSKWIDHAGNQILFYDYANFQDDFGALKAEIDSVHALSMQQPLDSILALIDVRNTFVSAEAAHAFQQAIAEARSHLRKTAVVGLNSLLNVGARSIIMFSGLQFSIFNDLDSAKDWLVE